MIRSAPERSDARAAARAADDEPFALEPTQRVADGREADVEPAGHLLEAKARPRRELEAADLLAKDAIDAVLDGRDLERSGGLGRHPLIFDQR